MPLDYKHNGLGCPVSDSATVIVQLRCGLIPDVIYEASKWRWRRWPEGDHAFDIVAYSIVGKPKEDGGTWTSVSGGYS